MLPRGYKIKKEEIPSIIKKGRNFSSSIFNLKFLPSPAGNKALFSVVVPKTVAKKATDRNIIKRRAFEAIKKNLPFPVAGYFIFFSKKEAEKSSFSLINKDISHILQIIL